MDVHTALICFGVFMVSAVVVYLISVLGIKEKTFEEAIEEQKRRSQETVVHSKTDKTKKDKKTFKKWSRRSKEKGNEKYQEDDSQSKNSQDHVQIKPEPEIIPESDNESKPPKNKKRKINVAQPKPVVKKEATSVGAIMEDKSNRSSDSESQDSKDVDKKLENAYKEVAPEPVCTKKEELPAVEEFRVEKETPAKGVVAEQVLKEIPPQITNSTALPKKKKPKQDQAESVTPSGSTITGSKLLGLLKDAVMTDEDIRMMIDFLLNKQGDISGWTKKNDPVTLLKKQLQEKEQALEDEQNKSQANLTKLRELRKEFNQEKGRFASSEQCLIDKLSQHQQEIQTLHASMKTTREHHQSELSSSQNKMQQLETKLNEKSKNIIKLQDENCRLEGILSSLEVEKKKNSSEVSKLNSELKQLKDIKEQYQRKQADLESVQKMRDEYQQKNQKLEEHVKQLTSSHKKDTESLQKQLSDVQKKLKTIETSNSAITEELNDAKSASSDVEIENSALRQRLQAVETVVKDREEEIKKLEASLEEASAQRTELESRLEQLQSKLEELMKSQDERVQLENEHQFPAVGERTSAEGEEAPHRHQNGDLHLETNNKVLQKRMLEFSEHERIVEEKEKALERLHDEVNEHKSTISSLTEELEQQKRKNNELREKNWKAMEAVSIAEKAAESKIEQLKKESSEQLTKCQKEAELRIEEARKKEGESRLGDEKTIQELKEAKERAEENLKKAEQRLQEENRSRELRLNEVQNELQQRLLSVENSLDAKTKEVNQVHEDYSLKLKEVQKREQDLLQRIFPEITVDQKLEHSVWITHYEQEAAKILSTLKSQVTTNCKEGNNIAELNDLRNQLSLAIEEKAKLDTQVQHYKTVLSETEGILNKLQNSVEAEEEVWRERLRSKERELTQVMKSNDELVAQQKVLEASLLQLQGVEEATSEMQAKLKELHAKLQGEESEKRILEQKFDEASNCALKLQEQLDSKLKELEESRKDKETLENLSKEIQQVKTQLEKERRITKDLSAQTVKLSSLVKIGQDALRAEQETVKKLQAQLQSEKSSNLNGPPAETASTVESESETPLINSEKSKSKKRDASGKK